MIKQLITGILSATILLSLSVSAQFANADGIFNSNIGVADIHPLGEPMLQAIIELNSNQRLEIRFDDLDFDTKDYAYRIRHCNWDWETSDLNFMQYMDGFETFDILEFDFSANTTRPYTKYAFTFPNEFMKPRLAGNYIVEIFLRSDEETVIIRRRFMVLDAMIQLNARVRNASMSASRLTHQELFFTLNTQFFQIQDLYQDLRIVIQQNRRWDNAIYGLPPRFVEQGRVHYDHPTGEMTFAGGNQYRFLDIKSLIAVIDPIIKYEIIEQIYHARLRPNRPRFRSNYSDIPDINGRFQYHNQENFNQSVDPDYVTVHFLLDNGSVFPDGDVYLIGGFSHGQLQERFRMIPEPVSGIYFLAVPMKQGYYNYMFAFKPRGNNASDVSMIEGSFAQAENEYSILVYLRQSGDLAHRLVAYTEINSFSNR
jgi:hypothetical protein